MFAPAVTTKPGKKYASIKNPRVYEALRRQGLSKARAARISNAQIHKDAGADAGAPLHGPGGLLATPGMGTRRWGKRKPRVTTKPMTRSEAARAAALARWGKYTPKPKKEATGRKRGRAAATPKKTTEQRAQEQQAKRTEREQQRQAEREQNRAEVFRKMGIAPDGQAALESLRRGEQPDPQAIARGGFVDAGLVERAADGSYRMTPAGRALLSSAQSGDVGRAGDTISGSRDRLSARRAETEQRRRAAAERRTTPGGGGKKQELPKPRQASEAQRRKLRKAQQTIAETAQRARTKAYVPDRMLGAGHTGVMVALIPDAAAAAAIAAAEGVTEPQEQLHLTLCFLGDSNETPLTTNKDRLIRDIALWAYTHGKPLQGQVNGVGRFYTTESDGTNAVYVAPDVPGLPELRQTLAQWIEASGFDYSQTHGFTPHITVAYVMEDAPTPSIRVETPVTFDRVTLAWSDEQYDFPMGFPMEMVKAGDPGDYLVVEDRAKPSTWHLQVKKNGKVDHRLMGAAWAALHGGYRGNTYQGPQKSEALTKLKRLYEQEGMPLPTEKSFTVFKDASGNYRWLARTTTAYRDRDGEIITTKALEADAARMTATGMYGPLRWWHCGVPDPFNPVAPWGLGIDIGDCDYSAVIGRTSIESGTFKSAAIGDVFAASADDYELSPGFFHPPDQPNVGGEYDEIRRFERSPVPVKYGRASNLFTGLTVKEARMDPQVYEQRVKAFIAEMQSKGAPPEAVAATLVNMERADKSAAAQGVAFKSDDAPTVFTAPDGTQGIIQDGRFVALKAAAPVEVEVEEAPAPEEERAYLGDADPSEFWTEMKAMLAPALKMSDMLKGFSDGMAELKSMIGGVATKDAGTAAKIAQLEAELATLKGDKPVVVESEALAALKSGGPQAPPDPNAPQVPDDPDRPWAGVNALMNPALYGYQGASGWQFAQPQPPQPNTGGD